MSRKRCIRKVWPTKGVSTIALSIDGARMIPQEDLDQVRLRELSSIESFAKGKAGPNDWRDVCDMLNLTETMADSGIGPEALEWVEKSQKALLRVKDAFELCGKMILYAEELKALRELYSWHDAQRQSVDRSTYEKAITKTLNRIRGNHPKVKVLV